MRRFGALVVGLSLVAAACGSDNSATDTTVADTVVDTVAPVAGGELEGMKGTTPLVDLSAELKDALNAFWTGKGNEALIDYSYAAESYDAVMLIAFAAAVAGTDGSELADQIGCFQRWRKVHHSGRLLRTDRGRYGHRL